MYYVLIGMLAVIRNYIRWSCQCVWPLLRVYFDAKLGVSCNISHSQYTLRRKNMVSKVGLTPGWTSLSCLCHNHFTFIPSLKTNKKIPPKKNTKKQNSLWFSTNLNDLYFAFFFFQHHFLSQWWNISKVIFKCFQTTIRPFVTVFNSMDFSTIPWAWLWNI